MKGRLKLAVVTWLRNDLVHRARRSNYMKGLNWLKGMPEAEQIPCKGGKFPLVVGAKTASALSCSHCGLQVLRGHLWAVKPGLGGGAQCNSSQDGASARVYKESACGTSFQAPHSNCIVW